MHIKTALAVSLLILGLCIFTFGVLAALGVTINLDLSSPGPIEGTERPSLEPVKNQDQNTDTNFRFTN